MTLQHDPRKTPQLVRVFGGPCDGTQVMTPKPEHVGLPVCIGLPAGPEHQEMASGLKTWCVYIWQPGQQRWHWLDYMQALNEQVLQQKMQKLTDEMGTRYKGRGR